MRIISVFQNKSIVHLRKQKCSSDVKLMFFPHFKLFCAPPSGHDCFDNRVFVVYWIRRYLRVLSIITTNKHLLSVDCQEHICTFFYRRPTCHTFIITPDCAAFSQSFTGNGQSLTDGIFMGLLLSSVY